LRAAACDKTSANRTPASAVANGARDAGVTSAEVGARTARKSGYKLGQPTPLATVAELVDYDAPVLLAPRVRAAEAAPIEQ
jgi:hypothetical protein